MGDSITRLYRTAKACQHDDPSTSRTARLLRSGRGKIAKKFAEEAIEVVIDTVQGGRQLISFIIWWSCGFRPTSIPTWCRRSWNAANRNLVLP
jgi:phosphoribosyl-ATP pyrophosphohydrolase